MAAENSNQLKDQLFLQLVLMFQTAAFQQMGKIQNPITGKIETDLSQAKFSIDILGMLQDKTNANLTQEEKKFLDHVLFELRMNYLDEVKAEEKKKEEKKTEPEEKKDSGEKKRSEEN
jgi:predicted nucleotide-binding protein